MDKKEGALKALQSLFKDPSGRLSPAPALLQLMGEAGSGCRRLALDFIRPARRILWLSEDWNLYAPLLWKMAEEKDLLLYGMECRERKRLRLLFKELLSSSALDGLIIDSFRLTAAEGFFLQKILRPHPQFRVVVIDRWPHSFCQERIHLSLSHQSFRYAWSKGGSATPRYIPFPYFAEDVFPRSEIPCLS